RSGGVALAIVYRDEEPVVARRPRCLKAVPGDLGPNGLRCRGGGHLGPRSPILLRALLVELPLVGEAIAVRIVGGHPRGELITAGDDGFCRVCGERADHWGTVLGPVACPGM